jgi:hypothetical protein
MTRHVILKRWEDDGRARASCSCGEQFAEPEWVQRALAIAEHKKAAKAQPVRHRPIITHTGGAFAYLRCAPCGWTRVVRGFDRADAVLSAHREDVTA